MSAAVKRKFLSLFSGAGGLDLGFMAAGWKPALMVDNWAPAVETLRANHPGLPVEGWDMAAVTNLQVLERLEAGGSSKEEIFCVAGGPPCQPFSRLNQNKLFETQQAGERGQEAEENLRDPRRSLFMDFLRMVRAVSPPFVVMENVFDLATRKLGGSGSDSSTLIADVIAAEMASAGYSVDAAVLRADEHGVPQMRRRIIFIGVRDDLGIDPSMPPSRPLSTSVRQEFAKIRPGHPNQEAKAHPDEWIERVSQLAPGQYYNDLPLKDKVLKKVDLRFVREYDGQVRHYCLRHPRTGRLGREFWTTRGRDKSIRKGRVSMEELEALVSQGHEIHRVMPRMGTYLRRIRWDVSHTVTRNPLIHPEENRELTVREKAAIQTFPPDYEFKGKRQDQHVLVGNAVPVNLGLAIAEHLEETWRQR